MAVCVRPSLRRDAPMKRGLKREVFNVFVRPIGAAEGCPDEEGIETHLAATRVTPCGPSARRPKTYPDEEGIETPRSTVRTAPLPGAGRRRTPTKRGLKRYADNVSSFHR